VRRFALLLVIALIVVAFLAVVGPELGEGTIIGGIGTGIRDMVGAIGDSIGFSARGFAG
jgi:hypothetical protein